jgi:hypothetical protein
VKWHGSFLVRCWRRDIGPARIEVEHIQSGEKTLVTSLTEAAEWMSGKAGNHAPSRGLHETRGEGGSERLEEWKIGTREGE